MAAATTLLNSLSDSPHAFLQPSLPLYTDTLAYLKHALDPVAAEISAVQQRRQQDARKKRKRGDHVAEEEVLRLKQIHTDGFGPEQVWEQARRVIDAARLEAERGIVEVERRERENGVVGNREVESELGDSELGEEGVDYEIEGVDDGEEEYEGESDDLEDALDQAEEGAEDGYVENHYAEDDVDLEGDIDIDEAEDPGNDEPAAELVVDKFGLNDGFFSIDEFNKQSEFLEQRDVQGEDDGAASDEEDIDWDADVFAQVRAVGGGANEADDDVDGEDDEEEDGPTFGDPDAPSEDENDELDAGELDGMDGMGNTNHITYADFFAPPAQKKRKNKKGRPNPHNFPAAPANGATAEEPEEDMERTIAAVHRDLFDDAESAGEEEGDNDTQQKDLDPSNPLSRRSTHERRKAALAEEIRKLEAANVAKRDWTLSGEARAADRPLNSLLEENLDFERAGKPVPVITAEVSEDIEDLIKRRILAHDFQDLVRRRPDDLGTGKDARRGRQDSELDDLKSKKGLAEEYEEEHLRRTDPNFLDAKSEKLKKEEKEIAALWEKVRSDLDSLSSWHFRPKAPAPQLEIRVDVPVIGMEDARPSAGGEVAGTSQLAPQEVYRAGEAVNGKEEVAGQSGLPAAREEMSRDEKKRRRRREKERVRKAGSGNGAKANEVGSKKGREKKEVVGDLKKGGVKVIGGKGRVTDVEGREARGAEAGGGQSGGGRYKL